jgi:hypothetical protein
MLFFIEVRALIVKKNPDSKVGGPNQKPLTIKPYPMKIHG